MYHFTVTEQSGTMNNKEYHTSVNRGKQSIYNVKNTNLSTEQCQQIVDMLVDSVFKQLELSPKPPIPQ